MIVQELRYIPKGQSQYCGNPLRGFSLEIHLTYAFSRVLRRTFK